MNRYREIDKNAWPRRTVFEYYRTFQNQLFNITLEVNAEPAYRMAKRTGRSFFLSMLYPLLRAVNAVPALRQRILDGERVVEFEHTAALTPILGADDTFTMALTEYADRFDAFLRQAEPAVAAATVPGIFIAVVTVKAPPNRRTASEGIGGKTFSMKIKRKIPKYPN